MNNFGDGSDSLPPLRKSLIVRHLTDEEVKGSVVVVEDGFNPLALSVRDNGHIYNDSRSYSNNNTKDGAEKLRRRFGSSTFARLSMVSLYNRTDHQKQLLQAFHRILDEKKIKTQKQLPVRELVLLTGPSGCGKSRLAKTLKTPVDTMGGYFLTAKFDQLQQPAPYAALVQAFTEFTSLVLARGDIAVAQMRKSILNAIDAGEISTLTNMIPSLTTILGKTDERHAATGDAKNRFVLVFQQFLGAVSSKETPMVLLLDDVHFADQGSFDILSSITKYDKCKGLVILGTCSDKTPNNVLSKLHGLEEVCNVSITKMEVQNLETSAVTNLVADILQDKVDKKHDLGKIATNQTGGNPAKVISFLRWLHKSDLLSFDDTSGSWKWNADEIEMTINTCKVDDYLVDELEQLPQRIKETLKVSACFGCQLNERLLQYVLGPNVSAVLEEAECMGVITRDESSGQFRFDHDYVQMAAYRLILPEKRKIFHLELGRRLWSQIDSEDELSEYLFTILSQLNLGKTLITSDQERVAVATLCWHAGTKAAHSSDFQTALFYLELGISMLGTRCWRDRYDLSLSLYSAAAEMALCNSDDKKLNSFVDEVLCHARHPTDKIGAFATRIYSLGFNGEQQEAVSLGLEVVEGLGERFPRKCSKLQLLLELKRVRGLLRGKSNEQILRIPSICNKEKLCCLRIFHLIVTIALLVRPLMYPFISFRMLKLTMMYGMSNFAIIAFSSYAMCETALGNVDVGLRYGQISLTLLERTGAKEFLPRAYAVYYGAIQPWRRPLKESLEPLRLGYESGLRTGDIGAACLSATLLSASMIACGVPLDKVERWFYSFEETMSSHRIESLDVLKSTVVEILQFVRGSTLQTCKNYSESLIKNPVNHASPIVKGISILNKLMRAYIFMHYDTVADDIDNLQFWRLVPGFLRTRILFFACAVALALAQRGRKKLKYTIFAKRIIRKIRRYARMSPSNALGMLYLLEAELASLHGHNEKAFEKYTASIAMHVHTGVLGFAGLSYERTARYFVSVGDKCTAKQYFDDACYYYEKWGALLKLRAVEKEVDDLYK